MAHAYKKNSITLPGAVAMGTGVMIGAGIFALTGQIAELAGPLFPLSFVVGAIVTAFSAYTYIKMSNAFPSAGGLGMILTKAYGPTTVAAGASLLMALSMVINESLVARTFGTYTLRAFGGDTDSVLVPVLGVALIVFAYFVNVSGSRSVGLLSIIMAVLKVGGIALFGVSALWASGLSFEATGGDAGTTGFVASVALSILAFKGFTTITNSGAEITKPHQNVGRAIVLSIAICVVVYLLVAFAVGSSLPLDRIVAAKDYALAEAAQPALGQTGFYLTVALALVATASGLIASVFAVSRMLAHADRHEDDSAQPFRHARHDQGPHARLYRRDRGLSDSFLRPQPDRLAWRLLLPGDGHHHPFGRLPAAPRGNRRTGLGAADSHRARCRGAGRLRRDEMAVRPADCRDRPRRHGAGVPVRAGVPRAQSRQRRRSRPPSKVT